MKENEEIKIIMKDNRIITRKGLFEKKEQFHKELAKIPFEEKIEILVRLQKIANSMPTTSRKKQRVWKISPRSSKKRF